MAIDEPSEFDEIADDADRHLIANPDWQIVNAAKALLQKVVRSALPRPVQLIALGKVLFVLERLPKVTKDLEVTIDIRGPWRHFNEREVFHWWQVAVHEGEVQISSGGYLQQQSVGGDTFTCMRWCSDPGYEPDYSNHLHTLWMIDDATDFVSEVSMLDFSEIGYSIDTIDYECELSETELVDEEAEDAT